MKKILSITLAGIAAATVFSLSAQAMSADAMAGVVATESGRLNVRSSASSASSVITSVKKGSFLTLEGKSGEWWKVEYAPNKFGFCHEDYIEIVSDSTALVSTQNTGLNVRSGAGKKYPITDSLAKGERVLVLSNSGYWARVLYDGNKTGCVSTDYLKAEETGYAAVSLDIPDYKQTDSRWANVKIGSSGKTIGQIGCVTTGIAMMESYRSGETIFPDEMMRELTYDGRGNVYWPSDYEVGYWSENYLAKIYEKLREGKPVLIGAKTSGGAQHWVVITGFAGGEELVPSKFTVNDPGSLTNTNLSQFFASFPNLYKFFWY